MPPDQGFRPAGGGHRETNALRFSLSSLIKASPVLRAVSFAVAVQMFAPEICWHPDCNDPEPFNQSAAAGLPFPCAQRAVATSDFFYMPHVLAANLLIVAGLALPVAGFLVRRVAVLTSLALNKIR